MKNLYKKIVVFSFAILLTFQSVFATDVVGPPSITLPMKEGYDEHLILYDVNDVDNTSQLIYLNSNGIPSFIQIDLDSSYPVNGFLYSHSPLSDGSNGENNVFSYDNFSLSSSKTLYSFYLSDNVQNSNIFFDKFNFGSSLNGNFFINEYHSLPNDEKSFYLENTFLPSVLDAFKSKLYYNTFPIDLHVSITFSYGHGSIYKYEIPPSNRLNEIPCFFTDGEILDNIVVPDDTGGGGDGSGGGTFPDVTKPDGWLGELFDFISSFFVVGDDYFSKQFDIILDALSVKLGFDSYIDFINQMSSLTENTSNLTGSAQVGVNKFDNLVFVDFSFLKMHQTDIHFYLRGFFYALLVIFNVRWVIWLIRGNVGGE